MTTKHPNASSIRSRRYGLLVGLFGAVLTAQAALARDHSDSSAKPAVSEPAPVAAEPQETSASFGDWVVRCQRAGEPARRVCEVAQSLVVKGQQAPIAQIAFGIADKDQMVTVLLPTNIAFDKPPQIGSDDDHMTVLAFRRCVPGGCLADAKVEGSMLKSMRNAAKPGRLTFTDASERTLALPVSFRGLAQALDDLAKDATLR